MDILKDNAGPLKTAGSIKTFIAAENLKTIVDSVFLVISVSEVTDQGQ